MPQCRSTTRPYNSAPSRPEGWAAGLVLGKAIENAYAANPTMTKLTPAALRAGMDKIKDDNFGGVTPPLTYSSTAAIQPSTNCRFVIKVANGKWTAPNGLKATCPPSSAIPTINAATKKLESSS